MKALTVGEHQRIAIGGRWSAAEQSVTRQDVSLLDRLQRRAGRRWFKLEHRCIRAGGWVGVVAIGGRLIEVVPKIDRQNEMEARENLHLMVATAGLVPVSSADVARLAQKDKPLIAAYMWLYMEKLATEWRRGRIRRYVLLSENTSYLRGKLLVADQLRDNWCHQERLWCRHDDFSDDNEASRLLKAGLRACRKQKFSSSLSSAARSLLSEFEDVGDEVAPDSLDRPLALERQHERFLPLVGMARLILGSESPASEAGCEPVYSLMFEMNVVFERFLAAELAKALAPKHLRVVAPARGRSLLEQNVGGRWRPRFQLEPDIAVYRNQKIVCIVDAKWKSLDPARAHCGVAQDDAYQMYAYGKEFSAPTTVMLYPRTGGLPAEVAEYRHHDNSMGSAAAPRVLVATVDVSQPLHRREIRNRFRAELARLVESIETATTTSMALP